MGSPPRMRGKVDDITPFLNRRGITPAYAGKRSVSTIQQVIHKDHPRVCGEKNIVRKASFDPQGSPPRMRGKGGTSMYIGARYGITPAYAGKRFARLQRRQTSGDHPRVCGEKFKLRGRTFSRLGSPPRMRGKDKVNCASVGRSGITPAYAGKSTRGSDDTACCWDHPRVCGEKSISLTLRSSL